jgi:subtilisin family serine protease
MKKPLLTLILIINAMICFSQSKISDALLEDFQQARSYGTTVEAMIYLADQFDTQALDKQLTQQKATCHERGVAVVTSLMEHAERTQADLVSYLESRIGTDVIRYQPFWITNSIFVEARPKALLDVAQHRDVVQLETNEGPELIRPVSMEPASRNPGHAEQGLRAINAHKMWQLGFTGEGVIVGGIDSGAEGTHPAVSSNWHGNSVPASQAWNDPGYGTTFPTDTDGHGTHITGIMCGLDPVTSDTIGVAFGAEWILGRVIWGSNSTFNTNLQWMLNPDGNAQTTDDMPSVVSNSWGDVPGSCTSSYLTAIQNLEAAGVAVVFAAGNSGPNPSTIIAPAKSNFSGLQVFSVGAVDGNYEELPITTFSSRGPTTCTQGGDQIKPEVTAPGNHVRSSWTGGYYVYMNGTSMATPHVAGAIALLKQAFPEKTGNELKQMLYETARDLGETGEDNTYGMGIIDVYQAYIENAIPGNPRPPDQVTAYSDFTTPAGVTLSWTDPAVLVGGEPLVAFEIQILRDNTLIASIPSGSGIFTDTGLTDGQHYEYSLRTHDLTTGNLSIDRNVSAWAGGSRVPAAPVILTGTYNPFMGITITWSDPTTQSDGTPIDDLALIYVYRDQVLLDSVTTGVESYNDNDPLYEEAYSYFLIAADNEEPKNYSRASSPLDVFAGTRPDILVYYGNAFGPVLDYVDSVYNTIRLIHPSVYKTNNLAKFGLPLDHEAIFVITGMYISYSHLLNSQDGTRLVNYLNNGGGVYIEGNMCFNSASVMAGAYNIRPWLGLGLGDWTFDPVNQLSGLNEFSGMDFQYPGLGQTWDILEPSTTTSTLWHDPGNGNIYGVYNEYNTGKIIGCVLPYGGLADPLLPENKPYLMCRYLQLLGMDVACYVGDEELAVGSWQLALGIYPNPASGISEIKYQISKSKNVVIKVLDIRGSEICTLVNKNQAPGEHTVSFDTSGFPAGIYLVRLQAGDAVVTEKMAVMR